MSTEIVKPVTVLYGTDTLVVADADVVARVQEIKARLDSVPEITEANMIAADEIAGDAKSILKAIESSRVAAKEGPLKVGKQIDRVAKDLAGPIAAGLQRVDMGIIAVKQARARKLAEAEAARRRAEEEARQREEALRALEAEAVTPEDKMAANALKVESRREGAKAWVEAVAAEPDELPSVGAHERTDKVVEVYDLVALPTVWHGVQLVKPDTAAIGRLLKAGVEVPGARLVEKKVTVRR